MVRNPGTTYTANASVINEKSPDGSNIVSNALLASIKRTLK